MKAAPITSMDSASTIQSAHAETPLLAGKKAASTSSQVESASSSHEEMTHSSGAIFSPPVLSPPKTTKCVDIRFIEAVNDIYVAGQGMMDCFLQNLDQSAAKLKELSFANAEKLKEAAKRSQENGVWSLLTKIGQCLLSALSFVIGVSLVATGAGAVIGSIMIASSIINIASFAMTEAHGWDWIAKKFASDEEKQKKIAFWLPTAIGIINAVVGVAGAAGGALWAQLNLVQKAIIVLQSALGLYNGVTTIGKGVSDSQVILAQADLLSIQKDMTLGRYVIENTSTGLTAIVSHMRQLQDKAAEIVALSVQNFERALYRA